MYLLLKHAIYFLKLSKKLRFQQDEMSGAHTNKKEPCRGKIRDSFREKKTGNAHLKC